MRVGDEPHVPRADPLRARGFAQRRVARHLVTAVVVDAQHVDRGADQLHIPVAHRKTERRQVRQQVVRIPAQQHGVEEQPVLQAVDPPHRFLVRPRHRVQVQRDARLRRRRVPAQLRHREPVRQQQVVRGRRGRGRFPASRRVHPRPVAEERRAPRFVQSGPERDAVAEPFHRRGREFGEPVRRVPVRPAAGLLQRLRQVEVVQRRPRLDAVGEQLVGQPVVEVQAPRVGRAAVGTDARPRDGEPVGAEPELPHQRDVLGGAVVVVGRGFAGVAARDRAGTAAEGVPDRVGAPVLRGRAFDLERGGAGAPPEPRRELQRRRHLCTEYGHAQPFTAPCMIPATIWRPSSRKTMRIGIVASVVPARTSE